MFLSDSSLPEMWSLSSGPLTSLMKSFFFVHSLFFFRISSLKGEHNLSPSGGAGYYFSPQIRKHKEFFELCSHPSSDRLSL